MTQTVFANQMTRVKLTTNFGEILLGLYDVAAPETVKNFLQYVNDKHYDGTLFHRVIDGFMIQGGGFKSITDEKYDQKPTRDGIVNESKNGLKNEPYTISMARTAAPHSATAQFFINVKNNHFLDHPGQDGWGYCVFGKVIEGTEVIDNIKKVKTTRRSMFYDVPVEDVVIEKAEVI